MILCSLCYRKKLDGKTFELQSKVKYWSEFASENSSTIPQVNNYLFYYNIIKK